MKKLIAGSVSALALLAIVFSTARADEHLSPGSPGSPGCRGQTTAYLAQASKDGHAEEALEAMGIGGFAHASGLTPAEIHDIVDGFCATLTPGP